MTPIEDRLKLFVNEINDIKDEGLREFAKYLISNADEYFFTVPASSSGKYHPPFDLGFGGLVRHTRCVAYFAKCMAIAMDFNEHDTDLLIVAALAHDIKKQGNNTGHTVREHPYYGRNYVIEMATAHPEWISIEDANKIGNAILSHMGIFENREPYLKGREPYPLPSTEFEKALHAADYVASRETITSFEFRPTEKAEIVEEHLSNPGDYVLQFGKHKGKTIAQAYATSDYIQWMISQDDFSNKEAQDAAKAYVKQLKEAKEKPVAPQAAPVVEDNTSTFTAQNNDIDDLPF